MRDEDQEILEEAIRNSMGGEDFDEMLLRATKMHLPRMYHRHFSVMLEEILTVADELGVSNRSAAQSLAKRPASAPLLPASRAPVPPKPSALAPAEKPADPTDDIIARHLNQSPAAPKAEISGGQGIAPAPPREKVSDPEPKTEKPKSGEPMEEDAVLGPSQGSVEKLPEEQKILDLGGTSPESLPPELKDKLRKLVKAQKRKQDWEEGAPEEEPAPGLFFKGQQRAPPFVPLTKPVKKEETTAAPAGKKPEGEDEEDLEEPSGKNTVAGK